MNAGGRMLFVAGIIMTMVTCAYAQTMPLVIDDRQVPMAIPDVFNQALPPAPESALAVRGDLNSDSVGILTENIYENLLWPREAIAMVVVVRRGKAGTTTVNHDVFNSLYNKAKTDEKQEIRAAWEKTLGFDVWRPYYFVKEIEEWLKERISIKICGFKGRPQFGGNKFIYTFKKRF